MHDCTHKIFFLIEYQAADGCINDCANVWLLFDLGNLIQTGNFYSINATYSQDVVQK